MSPTLRQLETLVLVYRLGSLTKAAAESRVTQSAISLAIRQTEEILGVRLFDRTTRALRPTPACQEAVLFAERILSDARGLADHMKDFRELKTGRVRVAASAGIACILPRVLTRYAKEHPDVSISLYDVDPDDLVSFVKSGAAEFGIGNVGTIYDAVIKTEPIVGSPLSAIGVRDGKFERLGQLKWQELNDFRLIAMRKGTRIRTQIDEALSNAGHELRPKLEVSLVTTSLALTAEKAGVSILPSHMLPMLQFPDLIAVPLVEPTIVRHVSVIARAEVSFSPASEAFLEMTRVVLKGQTEKLQ